MSSYPIDKEFYGFEKELVAIWKEKNKYIRGNLFGTLLTNFNLSKYYFYWERFLNAKLSLFLPLSLAYSGTVASSCDPMHVVHHYNRKGTILCIHIPRK